MRPVDDVLVHLRPPLDVVGLHRQHFLERIRRAIGLKGPHLHLAESLAAKLGLAAKGLLGDETVGARGTRMHLVVHQVVELEHVHVPHRDRSIERLPGASVEKGGLPGFRQPGQLQQTLDLLLVGTVEHRRGDGHTVAQVAGQFHDRFGIQAAEVFLLPTGLVVDPFQVAAHGGGGGPRTHHVADLAAQLLGGPTHMGLQNLADVHPRGHAQRVENDVDGGPVLHVRHVLHRDYGGDHALVAVPSRHLVARLHVTLDGQVDLDHFQNARRQIVAGGDLAPLLVESLFEFFALGAQLLRGALKLQVDLFVLDSNLEPALPGKLLKVVGADFAAGGQPPGSARRNHALQNFLYPLEYVIFEDALLILQILAHRLELLPLDRQCPRILFDAVASEYAHVDHGPVHPGRHPQGSVLHIGSLFAEDGTKEFFLGRKLGFPLRRHLANEDVPGTDFSADEGNTGFVELGQRRIAHVGNIAGDFLRTELRVPGDARELLDMDGGKAIFLHHPLGNQDRILEVVAVPRHERHQQVLPQRQFAQARGGAVGEHVVAFDDVSRLDQGTLVDAGVLV